MRDWCERVGALFLVTLIAFGTATILLAQNTVVTVPKITGIVGGTVQGDLSIVGTLNTTGNVVSASNLIAGAGANIYWSGRSIMTSPATGLWQVENQAGTSGARLKVDALPTAGACGASPAVTAGSTPLAGSIFVGTDTPASCIVIFGGTAFPSAPFCTANIVTTTAGSTRAIGALSTATQVTFTPATAFAASSTLAWQCISSK
jgi:hypothetical protein